MLQWIHIHNLYLSISVYAVDALMTMYFIRAVINLLYLMIFVYIYMCTYGEMWKQSYKYRIYKRRLLNVIMDKGDS